MRGLPEVERSQQFRSRRYDAVILGGALPGLVAAVRLAMGGARVCIVEETAARDAFEGQRDPFLVTGGDAGSVLGRCLRELGIPMIERQRIGTDPVAFQIVLPDARIDVGERRRLCSELVSWGFAPQDAAAALVRELAAAAGAEREAMLEPTVVRAPRRVQNRARRQALHAAPAPAPGGAAPARHARGLPLEVTESPAPLQGLYAAQCRALSNLGEAEPTPEALARLLGLPLEGSATFAGHECWLIGLLRDRIRALHGEFRTVDGDFALVTVSNHPGVAVSETGDVWCARALVLNAPRHALAGVVDQDPVPDLLATPAPSRRRLVVHLRMPRAQLPSGMARRVLVVRDPSLPPDGTNLIRVRAFAGEPRSGLVDRLASAVIAADEADVAAREHEIEAAVAELLPFARGELSRSEEPTPRWDRDDWLCDPPASRGWPAACDVRLGSRPATFAFDRAEIGALGFEGDLILGWRGGDVVAAELA